MIIKKTNNTLINNHNITYNSRNLKIHLEENTDELSDFSMLSLYTICIDSYTVYIIKASQTTAELSLVPDLIPGSLQPEIAVVLKPKKVGLRIPQ